MVYHANQCGVPARLLDFSLLEYSMIEADALIANTLSESGVAPSLIITVTNLVGINSSYECFHRQMRPAVKEGNIDISKAVSK